MIETVRWWFVRRGRSPRVTDAARVGAFGESVACRYYRRRGFRILARNRVFAGVENDLLVISGRTEDERSANDGDANADGAEYILRERSARQFYRSFAMPKDADAANVEATYRNGVLTVQLHKKPEAKPRQIEIRRG